MLAPWPIDMHVGVGDRGLVGRWWGGGRGGGALPPPDVHVNQEQAHHVSAATDAFVSKPGHPTSDCTLSKARSVSASHSRVYTIGGPTLAAHTLRGPQSRGKILKSSQKFLKHTFLEKKVSYARFLLWSAFLVVIL